ASNDLTSMLQAKEPGMQHTLRLFLLVEGASFVLAGLVHFGVLARGYEHGSAAIAESVIGAVLLIALTLTWVLPAWTRTLGIAAQAFALLGTLVGAFTIAIGVGPRTVPDVMYHARSEEHTSELQSPYDLVCRL